MTTTTKHGSAYQACAHQFAYADQNEKAENYGNRMFFEDDTIYSYGYHFIIAKKIRNKRDEVDFILFNSDKHSNTTSKQQWCVKSALYQHIIEVSTDIDNFNAVKEIKQKEVEMFKTAKLYSRARAEHMKNEYLGKISQSVLDIRFLADYYRVNSKIPSRIKAYLRIEDNNELLEVLGYSEANKNKADRAEQTRAEKKAELHRIEQAKKEVESIDKWKNNKLSRIYLRHTKEDFLRVSKDQLKIETSQGISITIKEANRLLKLIDYKKIIGAKIDDTFVVTAFNGFLKVGCHNIPLEEINSIREQI